MLQPHSSGLSQLVTSSLARTKLPTGKSFGSSTLKVVPLSELMLPIAIDSESMADRTSEIAQQQPSSLAIEVGKIVVVALWFWCLVGANFCFDTINSISNFRPSEV
ncbi:hypothetical protein [Chamaesiphon minutus]|uniref:Uncharacterized protein n=1 Tax=Chamaesiphon minutus (strain ATCC 27169 / PCC 6605) TaxID=1173020 RepID=K9UFU5_CHAP6|nr:hypothetical protein [Chamaesiphon minutus]AFY93987.1 hypothetical protein Cha6605_2955 [Chamaesiphon minutus PCC 6605]